MAIFTTKEWKDRLSENPSRRRLSPVDGEQNVYDVSREEGDVSQEGTAFSADNMNDLENRINTSFNGFSGVRTETVLYAAANNSLGKNTDFYLNGNIKDYDYVGYYFSDGDPLHPHASYTEINAKDRTEAVLTLVYPMLDRNYTVTGLCVRGDYIETTINETNSKIVFRRHKTAYINEDGTISFPQGDADIYIKRVLGYKLIKNN